MLLLVACLSWAGLAMVGAGNDGTSVPRVAETANDPPGGPKALAVPDNTDRESMVEVPDVSGRSLEGAVRIISDAGFEVTAIESRTSRGGQERAIGTEPQAGAPAKPGAPVILTMGGPAGIPPGAQDASASATASASASAGYAN